jgi:hypothetical protein
MMEKTPMPSHPSSPFYRKPPEQTPGAERIGLSPTEQVAQQQLRDTPTRDELEEWYNALNDYLIRNPDEDIADVRDSIYRYLH